LQMLFKAAKVNPPVGAALVADVVGQQVAWGEETSLDVGDGVILTSPSSIIRYFARSAPTMALYAGDDPLSRTEMDHWLTFSIGPLACSDEFEASMKYLSSVLTSNDSFLVGKALSAADYAVFGALNVNADFQEGLKAGKADPGVTKWYKAFAERPEIKKALARLPKDIVVKKRSSANAKEKNEKKVTASNASNKGQNKADRATGQKDSQGGKFVDLPDAEMGKVVVRFPPEASGYLHIGHAKAALLNQHYRDSFRGKLILRFDDTNPAKEKEEFEEVIKGDLKALEVKYDHFSRSSDHFAVLLDYCEKLIKEGKAYVDDTDAETMKAEREAKRESKNRGNTVEVNLRMWKEMKRGSEAGQRCAVRAKIDMASANGCMRDPTIYRCKVESHPATGEAYKVYPTYDFACPVVDSIEGVTHALRTTEYMDRDEQFNWFIDALGLRKPHIYAYARLNMTNTVMSKRKLTHLVDSGVVDGWNDPRLPTVRGVLARGLTVAALKEFIVAQGSSRSVVFMEWDKIWAINKKLIDPVAPRYTAVEGAYNVPVNIKGAEEKAEMANLHPKDPTIGTKTVWRAPRVLIDGADAEMLTEGANATFINWGNLKIEKIHKSGDKVTSVEASLNLEDKDFKKTLKVTWLANTEKAPFTPTVCVYYDHVINKPILDKDDDFKNFIGENTKVSVDFLGDPELKKLKKGDIIQIQRRGFFIVDRAYQPMSASTCQPTPVRLIAIPDGTPGSYGPPGKKAEAAAAPAVTRNKGGAKKESPASKKAEPSVNAVELNASIVAQGDNVRKLKAEKATKEVVQAAVKVLLDLKVKYKEATGKDWKPGDVAATAQPAVGAGGGDSPDTLNDSIMAQGDLVRKLKGEKADKVKIDGEVKTLLSLKSKYKEATGKDWKPGQHKPSEEQTPDVPAPVVAAAVQSRDDVLHNIAVQGNVVRQLKGGKAEKGAIEAEVNKLLALKAQYENVTGEKWKPGLQPSSPATNVPPPAASSPAGTDSGQSDDLKKDLSAKIEAQGDLVRKLKAQKADKADVDANVKILLSLKGKYKEKTGEDWKPPGASGAVTKKEAGGGKKGKQQAQPKKEEASKEGGKQTRLGIEAKKEENLADWYSQVIVKSEMLEYYDVSGCYILRPWAFSIWEAIQAFFDKGIKEMGVDNCYFPIFVSNAALQREKDHIEDFAPEVAWVTRSGDSELAEPIAIRPTSETVMYPTFAKWIQSYRDLPIKVNQWCNVVVSSSRN